MRDLNGKRALITGGGGGIGRALAAALAAAGAEPIVGDVDAGRAEAVAAGLRRDGGRATALRLDVTDANSIAAAREAMLSGSGAPDVLVNNAGIVRGGPFAEVSAAEHRQTVAVNLDGMMAITHAFLDDLVARPEAHIVNIVSASAFVALPFAASYAASKWGALGFSESLRHELRTLGHRHVHVTAICPAYVRTGMFAGAQPPPLTPFLTPQALAGAVVRAIHRNTAVARVPWTVQLSRLAGLLPTAAFDRLQRALGVHTSMRHWTGHDRTGHD